MSVVERIGLVAGTKNQQAAHIRECTRPASVLRDCRAAIFCNSFKWWPSAHTPESIEHQHGLLRLMHKHQETQRHPWQQTTSSELQLYSLHVSNTHKHNRDTTGYPLVVPGTGCWWLLYAEHVQWFVCTAPPVPNKHELKKKCILQYIKKTNKTAINKPTVLHNSTLTELTKYNYVAHNDSSTSAFKAK